MGFNWNQLNERHTRLKNLKKVNIGLLGEDGNDLKKINEI
jgi:hypothetical protein